MGDPTADSDMMVDSASALDDGYDDFNANAFILNEYADMNESAQKNLKGAVNTVSEAPSEANNMIPKMG